MTTEYLGMSGNNFNLINMCINIKKLIASPLIFMGAGFVFNAALMFLLIFAGDADWNAFIFIYTMVFLLYQLVASVPIKKTKNEVVISLKTKYVGDAEIDIERLIDFGLIELAQRYSKWIALGSFNVGAYFSWIILVFYFIVTRSGK